VTDLTDHDERALGNPAPVRRGGQAATQPTATRLQRHIDGIGYLP